METIFNHISDYLQANYLMLVTCVSIGLLLIFFYLWLDKRLKYRKIKSELLEMTEGRDHVQITLENIQKCTSQIIEGYIKVVENQEKELGIRENIYKGNVTHQRNEIKSLKDQLRKTALNRAMEFCYKKGGDNKSVIETATMIYKFLTNK